MTTNSSKLKFGRPARLRWAWEHNPWWSDVVHDILYPALASVFAILYFVRRNQDDAATEELVVIVASFVVVLVLVPVIELGRLYFRAAAALRDAAIARLETRVASLEATIPPPGIPDVDLELGRATSPTMVNSRLSLIQIPSYIINHRHDRNAVLQFELRGFLNGKRYRVTNEPFQSYRKQDFEWVKGHLPNPKDATAGGNWGDPIGFLVSHAENLDLAALDDEYLIVTERHSQRKYKLDLPGSYKLKEDQFLVDDDDEGPIETF